MTNEPTEDRNESTNDQTMTDDTPSDDSTDDHHEIDTEPIEAFLLETARKRFDSLAKIRQVKQDSPGVQDANTAAWNRLEHLAEQAKHKHNLTLSMSEDTVAALTDEEEEVARVTHKNVQRAELRDLHGDATVPTVTAPKTDADSEVLSAGAGEVEGKVDLTALLADAEVTARKLDVLTDQAQLLDADDDSDSAQKVWADLTAVREEKAALKARAAAHDPALTLTFEEGAVCLTKFREVEYPPRWPEEADVDTDTDTAGTAEAAPTETATDAEAEQ